MGPHMGSIQFLASISFLGVTFLTSSFSVFLMGLSPYERLSLLSGRVPCCLRPAALSSFDANLAQQRRNKNRRQSESGIRQALSAGSDGGPGSHQTPSDGRPEESLKKGSVDRVSRG